MCVRARADVAELSARAVGGPRLKENPRARSVPIIADPGHPSVRLPRLLQS